MSFRRLLTPVVLCLVAAPALLAQQFTRIAASDFVKDPAKVKALQQAVAAMKLRNTANPMSADFRTSWAYWAATHGYLGTGKHAATTAARFKSVVAPQRCAGAVPKNVCLQYYDHVTDSVVPNDGFTNDIWGTCQHGNMQFLPWHRMYLIFFERTLRKSSGDPKFALPYWDYYNELGPMNGVAVPALVRGPSTGSLYDEFRTPGLNTNTSSIDPNDASAEQAFKATGFRAFSKTLEGQPHGSMHCGTGFDCDAPDIGIVPVAGLDPVFYMHHANIDRLWQCWMLQKAKGQPITLDWAKKNLGEPDSWFEQTWQFVDENGKQVSMAVKDLFLPGVVDYTYANFNDCGQGPPQVVTLQAEKAPAPPPPAALTAPAAPVAVGKATRLHGRAISVHPTRPMAKTLAATTTAMAMPPDAEFPSGDTLLILDDVRFEAPPGVTYDVYIAPRKTPARRAYVATLNLFGLFDEHDHTAAKPGYDHLFWDITNQLARLAMTPASDIDVTFVPSNGMQGAKLTEANAAGAVMVGYVRIQQVP
ncbi:MAG TPA: tyrosinase family protein [Thermoanaerobaculia bacterium]|nr:tyrosinase family protein [Thermoanaerobaculia bacterium]